jgi:hypothetical protein
MITYVRIRLTLVAFGVVALAFALTAPGTTLASPPGPGWELSARTFPTNLLPAVNEVQDVAVNATGGTFTLAFISPSFEYEETAPIAYNAPATGAGSVQEELRALPSIGSEGVSVTSSVEGATTHYLVAFTGPLGGRGLYKLKASGTELQGAEPTATVTVKTQGAGGGTIEVDILNIGEAASSGPITVTDTLPAGLTAIKAGEMKGIEAEASDIAGEFWNCSGNGPGGAVLGATVVTCTNDPSGFSYAGGGGGPSEPDGEGPNQQPQLGINVKTESRESTGINRVTIAGGGAPTPASTTNRVNVSAALPPFEVTGFDGGFSNADGTPDTQAGSHPYAALFSFDLPSYVSRLPNGHSRLEAAGGELKNLVIDLPPGLVGNPNAVPQCSRLQLIAVRCPNASQIGIVQVYFSGGASQTRDRLYNMVPPVGGPAEFGFQTVEGIDSYIDSSVRSGSDYGITTSVDNAPTREIVHVVTTLWGVPGDPSHVIWRDAAAGGCSQERIEQVGRTSEEENECKPIGESPKPFLTLPTACAGPQTFTIHADSWQHPDVWTEAQFESHNANDTPTGFSGCEDLAFGPSLTAAPDTVSADTPAGLTVEVKPSIGGLEDPEGDGTADIKETVVTLPPGVVINPGQAAGLQACQPSQDGLTTQTEREKGEEDTGPPSCPNASKVGTVKAKTPLLEAAAEKELEGNVYVLQSNPPNLKLLAAFSADGVNVKLVLNVHLNEATGQLTTTVPDIPELPVSEFKLSFSGGAQAALDTPAQCGTYETTSNFTSWSSPFVANASPTSFFAIASGPGGSSCPSSPLPFSPALTAGSTTDHAGGFTDFSMLLERGDGQQRIDKLQFKAPQGLAGMISAVPLCGEPQAAAGTCPASSQVGHSTVSSGPGPYPLVVPQPGEPESPIYLTGPYDGAPFGLSIVTHVIAGPFNLGTIVTRAKIEINPQTAQITVTTDPLPQVVDGVPTDLRLVDAVIDRPGFMFNPTNCESSSFSGTAWGAPPPGASEPGDTAAIGSRFGVGSCKELTFKPTFTTSTKAQASKANGAGLSFKISYPKGAQGSESWFNEAQFDIPRQLPARLSTLQQSCLAATYETNRAACPKASIIGHAVVHTPVLPDPLEGPVYFVSYGSAKFPDAVLDLTGDNVHIELHGETFISKTSVTSATFRNTPDVPFESIEVNVPTGPYSEFGANLPPKDNYDFCGQKLKMPTFFKAQNGLEIHEETPVTITGCPKPKKAKKTHKKHTKTTTTHKKTK